MLKQVTSEQYRLHSLILIVFTFVFGSKKLSLYLQYRDIVICYSIPFYAFSTHVYSITPFHVLLTILCPNLKFLSSLRVSPKRKHIFWSAERLSVSPCNYLTSGKYRWDKSDRETKKKTSAATEWPSGKDIGFCKLKELALDCTVWRNGFGRGCGRVVRQTTWCTNRCVCILIRTSTCC